MSIQNYKQYNYNASYASGSFASQGCGPTSVADLVGISPLTTADWLTKHGYASTDGHGTYWEGIAPCLSAYGGNGRQLNGSNQYGKSGTIEESTFRSHVQNGACGILLMGGPSYWTGSGHFIAIVGYKDGAYLVHDPASTLRDGYHPWKDFKGLVKVYYTSSIRWAGVQPITDGHAFTVGIVNNGSQGPIVKLAQEILCAQGFYNGRLDGDSGPFTVCAIRDFQKAKGLATDGICGLNTWVQLLQLVRSGWTFTCKTVNRGSKSADSTRLVQSILKAQGFKGEDGKALKIDGDAGNNTVYAIRAYQTKRHQQGASLAIDGSAGPATLTDMIGF